MMARLTGVTWLSCLLVTNASAVDITFSGRVHADRGDVIGILPPCEGITIDGIAEYGQSVKAGDAIVTFNTAEQQKSARMLAYALAIEDASYELDRQRLENEVNKLHDSRKSMSARLAVVQARMDKLQRIDEREIRVLEAERDAVAQRLEIARRSLAQTRVLFELGEVSREDVSTAEVNVTRLAADLNVARLTWERERERIDGLSVASQELRRRELQMELGRPEQGGDVPDGESRGIEKRIEALQREIAQKQRANRINRDRIKKRLHEAERDARDCTPVAYIEILDATGTQRVQAVTFQPQDQPVPDGYLVDSGETFAVADGLYWGWDRDLRDRITYRTRGAPVSRGVALVCDTATWRIALPDGAYHLRVGFGDTVDWHGALARVVTPATAAPLLVEPHLEAPCVGKADVIIENGQGLAIVFGTPHTKASLATRDCIALPREWMRPGFRIGWEGWPIAFIALPEQFKVRALVHQELLPLLQAASPTDEPDSSPRPTAAKAGSSDIPPALRLMRLRREAAATDVIVTPSGGLQVPGRIVEVGSAPVAPLGERARWFTAGSKVAGDAVARELLIGFAPTNAATLRLGESVQCRAQIEPGPDMRVVPVHLVIRNDATFSMALPDGATRTVEGFRVGSSFVLTGGLEPHEHPAFPSAGPDGGRRQQRRFPGQVTAGESTKVAMPGYWGRIRDLVPEGSNVTNGQVVVRLYNPSLASRRERTEEARDRERQRFLVAIETRRVKSIEAQRKHNIKVLNERRTHLEIRKLSEYDPIPVARARATWEAARLEASRASEKRQKARNMAGIGASERADIAFRAALRTIAEEKARIALVQRSRALDWLAIQNAREAWQDAIEALSFRESELDLIRKEEQVARASAKMRLEHATRGSWRERAFDRMKDLEAQSAGRIFYKTGWNDQANTVTKIGKDFLVWGGLAIAEILDMSQLAMEIELPEEMYARIHEGDRVDVGFDHYPGVQVPGIVDRVGRSFKVPEDIRDTQHGEQPVSMNRVFTAVVRYSPPGELADELVPGTKGFGILREE